MSLKYKAVLFDNDGTVVDTEECIMTSVRHVLYNVLGDKTIDLDGFRKLIGLPTEDQFAHYTDDPQKVKELTSAYRAHNDTVLDKLSKNFEGMPEALRQIKNWGYYMGIVTSKRHDICIHGLKELGLTGIFEYVQGNDDWHVHKPDPGALTHACEEIKCNPEDVLYIGDSPFDLQAGNGAGCYTCAVTWGVFKEDELTTENPNFIARTPQDLLELLQP